MAFPPPVKSLAKPGPQTGFQPDNYIYKCLKKVLNSIDNSKYLVSSPLKSQITGDLVYSADTHYTELSIETHGRFTNSDSVIYNQI